MPIHPNLVHLTLGLFIVAIAFDIAGVLFPINEPILKSFGLAATRTNLLTGFHGLHVFAGLLLQLMVLIRSLTPYHATPESHFGFSATALFWHFVDIIWIILFALLYLWR